MITAFEIEKIDCVGEIGRLIDQVFCQVRPFEELEAAEQDGSI